MEEIIYFELNNWFSGRDYPTCEPIKTWVNEYQFNKDEWCRENKLCVLAGPLDMSQNWCITAPKSWVEEHFPKLLTDEHYTYTVLSYHNGVTEKQEHDKAYSDFRKYPPDDGGSVYGQFDWRFLEYEEENFGVTWCNDDGIQEDEDYDGDVDED